MVRMLIIVAIVLLSGCAVTLHGNQTSGGGSTFTNTGSSVQGGARVGNARVGSSFGTPPTANSFGGQVSLSKGATGLLVLVVVMAGVADEIGALFKPAVPRPAPRTGEISQTCSCYGWQPELTADSQPQ